MRPLARLALLCLFATPGAQAGPFVGTTLSADGGSLVIQTADEPFPAPKTEEEQQGYAHPRQQAHRAV